MNLYLRLVGIIIYSFLKSRVAIAEKISLPLRIFPNDLDINNHVNNGRYLALLDLGSIHLFIRSGLLKHMLMKKLRPIIGGIIITYRKGLKLFERCTLTIQLTAWDDRWNYFRFEFRNSKGELSAKGFFKGGMANRDGFYPNRKMIKFFGYDRIACEIPPEVAHWIASEKAMTNPNAG